MAGKAPSYFEDEAFQDRLLWALVKDSVSLQQAAPLLEAEDFKPLRGMRWGRPRWIVAGRVLEYFQKYQRPVGKLLRSDILEYANGLRLGDRQTAELEQYITHIRKQPLHGFEAVVDKVVRFKQEKLQAHILDEMVEAQAAGALDAEKWSEYSAKVTGLRVQGPTISDYFGTLEDRIDFRARNVSSSALPAFFIDPFDLVTTGIRAGHLGMVLAPTGRGKSLFLLWLAMAYSFQGLNVHYFTLEDGKEETESRLDAAMTGIPAGELTGMPKKLRNRLRRRWARTPGFLHVIDGTETGVSVPDIDNLLHQEAQRGHISDVVLVDYDEEVRPVRKHKERRFEFDEIYRALRRLAKKRNKIFWTAAQTTRGVQDLKIFTDKDVAEDAGKIRKVACCVGIGKGEWPDSLYLHIVKHKFNRPFVGCNIVPDLDCNLLYDREATIAAQRKYEGSSTDDEEDALYE